VGYALLGALTALALLEHWFMVLPLPDERLWRWMLPEPSNANPSHNDKRGSPMNFDKLFQAQLDQLKEEGNYRIFAELQRKCGDFPEGPQPLRRPGRGHGLVLQRLSRDGPPPQGDRGDGQDGRGMRHRRRRHAQHLGQRNHHKQLEAELADLHHKEDALLFTSGYVSNWAALSTLGSACRTR
jgi:hypothetical protein